MDGDGDVADALEDRLGAAALLPAEEQLTAPAPPYLGVAHSLTGRRWLGPSPETERAADALAQATALPPAAARVLARAGIGPEEAPGYLAPKLRELMPDPSHLKDMDRAVERLLDHLERGSRIALFADYDVDGAASAALLAGWLEAVGVRPTVYVPDRIDEGYGPNVPAMTALAEEHALILCLDCGTLAFGPIAAAVGAGAEVLVLDHHTGGETLPEAAAVVNPNRQDETSPLSYLCAAGVVYLFLVALNRARRAQGASEPSLLPFLDLVALATVADVAPLLGLNRALVRQGLLVMARRERPGLVALADVAGLTAAPRDYHLGYVLGPRINAGGRVGEADLGARLLLAPDLGAAEPLAARLDGYNQERRAIEAEVLAEAMAQIEARGAEGPLVWAAGPGWHPGVVGIVASRLKEAFHRPAVAIGLNAGTGTGSGRSVPGVDLGAAVASCTAEGLFLKGGGHPMAAGLTLEEAQLTPAMARLGELIGRQRPDGPAPKSLRLDGALTPGAASVELIESLEAAGPYGAAAPEPCFAFPDVRISGWRRVGETHLSLDLTAPGGRLRGFAFGAFDGPLGPALTAEGKPPFHIAGRLEIDDWGGRRAARLRLVDAAPAT